MRETRIFQPGPLALGQTLELSKDAGQHIGVVLRMQPNMMLTLFCGDNHEYKAIIQDVRKQKVRVHITEALLADRESSQVIHLAQAISKGDRMEWVMQKAVELGVSSITPIITAHCAVKLDDARLSKKQLQWQAIVIAACEQSGRNIIPPLYPAMPFAAYLKQCSASMKLILHPKATLTWHDISASTGDIAIIIGPEGGLSEAEIQQATAVDFKALSLGPRVLRTETAALAALSVLQATVGDL
jgi:16S rRNA (uracil1498-N3)-methyltransferase